MPLQLNPVTGELDLVGEGGGAAGQTDLTGDVGGAVSPDGADSITLIGDETQAFIQTTGTPASNKMEVKLIEPAADGELLIGNSTTGEPSVATLTGGNGITIANGAGSITVTADTADDLSVPTDSGTAESSASTLSIIGGTGVDTAGSGNTVTINAAAVVPTSFNGDSGTATPAGNTITLAGGTGVTTSGSGSTVTFESVTASGWNGTIEQTPAVSASSDGVNITFSVERSGGGDLTVIFSSGEYEWDTTPADTVALTPGSDTSPTLNYVYFLESTLTLTASTAGWPSAEHAPLATVLCQSAASFQTDGPYKFHAWTDHLFGSDDQGHISHLNFWIRQQDATYVSGVDQTYTITPNGGAADNVVLTTASGIVLQLHEQTFPAFSGTPDYYVVNDNATPYNKVTDLNALLTDSTGASMSGKYFSLVIWGVVSQDTGDCKLMVNLPGGSYGNQTSLEEDLSKYANYTIPTDFTGTGFLISEWKLRHQTASGGTWTSIDEIDLRGLLPSISAGGSATGAVEFPDNTFRIFDDGDSTKKIAFQVSGITTSTVRTYTAPDTDGTLVLSGGSSTDNAIPRWDGSTGGLLQDSSVLIDDSDVVSGATQINVDNLRLDGNTVSSTDTNGDVILSPDGTGGVVATTDLTVGNSSQDNTFTVNGASIDGTISAEGTNSTALGGIISHRHSATAGFGGHFLGLRSRGSHASPTIVADNDVLAIEAAAGYDGVDYALAGQINIEVDGTPGIDDMPGRIILSTSADGAQTPTEGFRLDSSQIVTLANALPETSGGTNQTTYTAGDILYSDAANSLAKLAKGTDGQVLTLASGLPSWAASAGGQGTLTLLATATASSSSSIDFTSSIDSTYNMYFFVIDALTFSNDDVELLIRTSTDGGSSFDSGSTDYQRTYVPSEGASDNSSNSDHIIFGKTIGNASSEYVSGNLYLINPSNTVYTRMYGRAQVSTPSGLFRDGVCSGQRRSDADVDAIRFFPDAGTIDSGTIKMYGMTTPS